MRAALLLVLIGLAGCASGNLHDQFPQAATAGLVYVNMPRNLMAETHTEAEMVAAGGVFAVVSMGAGAAIAGANLDLNLRADRALQRYSEVVDVLPFREQMFDHMRDIVHGSPWLPSAALQRVNDLPDGVEQVGMLMRQEHKDSMVCIWPEVLLDRIGQNVHVGYHVALFVSEADELGHPHAGRYRYRDFVYSYPLRLHDPEPSWQQQKADAQLMAGMSIEDAVPYWMADNGAQLRHDFADALPKLDADLARYLGSTRSR